jgi:hypothetical protein
MLILKELLQLGEMAKRSTMNDFYAAAKKKYGAQAVKDIKWSDVVALARELDVTIPAAAHKNKTGKGRVSLIPDDHADAKAPAKEEPKKEEPKAEPRGSLTDSQLRITAGHVYDSFKNDAQARWSHQDHKPEKDAAGAYVFEFRDWGVWEDEPSDNYDREDHGDDWYDDGDNDFQVPTAATRKAIEDKVAKLSKFYKVDIEYFTGEKGWLTVVVKNK